jgi:hypothetical protein
MTEMVIQQLLHDAGATGLDLDLVSVEPQGLEVAADWRNIRTPESYLGYRQANAFAQDDVARFDQPAVYRDPGRLPLNAWGLTGTWTVAAHAAVSQEPGDRISFRFHARDVNLVMGPTTRGQQIRFRVLLDGEAPDTAQGTDVGVDGHGAFAEQATYQLIRQTGPITERTFEIEFLDSGAEAYCFTFG